MKLKFKTALGLAEALGYDGAKTAADVQKFFKSQPDEVSAEIDGKDIAVKTVTISVSADAGEDVQVIDETPEGEAAMGEGDDDPAEEMKRLKQELADARAAASQHKHRSTKAGQRQAYSGSSVVVTDPIDRAAQAYDRRVERGETTAFKTGRSAVAFGSFVRNSLLGHKNYALRDFDQRVLTKAMGTSPNSAGGALADVDFAQDIIELKNEFGAARRLMGVEQMGSDRKILKRLGSEVTITVDGENATRTASDITTDNIELVAKTVSAITESSNEILQDASPNLADVLARSMVRRTAQFEDDAAFNGDGTSEYGGFLGFENVIVSGSASYVDLAVANLEAVTLAKVNEAIGKLPEYAWSLGNVQIACPLGTYWRVFHRLASAAGGSNFGDISGAGPNFRYNGIPVVVVNTLTDAASDTDTAFYIGAFDLAAKFGERLGVQIDSDDGGQYFERNQTAYRLIERIDIKVHEGTSTTEAGPVIRAII